MTAAVLVINAGSSSIKYAIYEARPSGVCLAKGLIDRIGLGPEHHSENRSETLPMAPDATHAEVLEWLAAQLQTRFADVQIVAGGHRVVHGGPEYSDSLRLTPEHMQRLDALSPLAPGHQPHNLAGVRALENIWPDIPQIACFDTAFHRTQPTVAQSFAIPRALTQEGVLRYGFHGLSYAYIASQLTDVLGDAAEGRVIVLHLGHGASVCAMQNRKSIATSMGFTALDGLMMGKRCGEIDPGVIFHLIREKGMSAAEVETLLSTKSGLLGVSGQSDDMRDLLASDRIEAKEAIALFVYRACAQIGRMAAALQGVDAIVFTGGMGENAARIRSDIIAGSQWLGVHCHSDANAENQTVISTNTSAVKALVIPTNEELVIANDTRTLVCTHP